MRNLYTSKRPRPKAARPRPAVEPWPYRSALVIVAHPDDEVLWAGGTILMHPETQWTVAVLCRRSDPDRVPKFRQVLETLGAAGYLGNIDDGPEQKPLPTSDVQDAVLALVGRGDAELILTHSTSGEYTRHRRHEEVGTAVLALWDAGRLRSREVWSFAYQDAEGRQAISAVKEADVFTVLTDDIRERKRDLIVSGYGFAPDSFEAKAALGEEAFWRVRPMVGRHCAAPDTTGQEAAR